MRRVERWLSTIARDVHTIAPTSSSVAAAALVPSLFTSRSAWQAYRSSDLPAQSSDFDAFWVAATPFHPFSPPGAPGNDEVATGAGSHAWHPRKRRKIEPVIGRRAASVAKVEPRVADRAGSSMLITPRQVDKLELPPRSTSSGSAANASSRIEMTRALLPSDRDRPAPRPTIAELGDTLDLDAANELLATLTAVPSSSMTIDRALQDVSSLIRAMELCRDRSFVDRAVAHTRVLLQRHASLEALEVATVTAAQRRNIGAAWIDVLDVRRTSEDVDLRRLDRALDAVFAATNSAGREISVTTTERAVQARTLDRLIARWTKWGDHGRAASMALNLLARYPATIAALFELPSSVRRRLSTRSDLHQSVDIIQLQQRLVGLVDGLDVPLHVWLEARLAAAEREGVTDVTRAHDFARAVVIALGAREADDGPIRTLPDVWSAVSPVTSIAAPILPPTLADDEGVHLGDDMLRLGPAPGASAARSSRAALDAQSMLEDALRSNVPADRSIVGSDIAAAGHGEALSRMADRPMLLAALQWLHETAAAANPRMPVDADVVARITEATRQIEAASSSGDANGILTALYAVVDRQRASPPHSREGFVDRQLIKHAIRALIHVDRLEAVRELLDRLMHDYDRRPPPQPFVWAMAGFARRGDPDGAFEVAHLLRQLYYPASRGSLTAIASAYARRAQPDQVRRVHEFMTELRIEPDAVNHTILMQALLAARQLDQLVEVFDHMRITHAERVEAGDEDGARLIKPDRRAYQVLASAGVAANVETSLIMAMYERTFGDNFVPSGADYSTILRSAWRDDDVELAERVFAAMDHLPRGPDIRAFTQMIQGLIGSSLSAKTRKESLRRIASAKAIYGDMLGRGLKPDAVTALTIVRGYATGAFGPAAIGLARSIATSTFEAIPLRDLERKQYSDTVVKLLASTAVALGARHRPSEAVSLLSAVRDGFPRPSIFVLSALINIYARSDDTDGTIAAYDQLWLAAQSLERNDAKEVIADSFSRETTIKGALERALRDNDAAPVDAARVSSVASGEDPSTIRTVDATRRDVLRWPHTLLTTLLGNMGREAALVAVWRRGRLAGYAFGPDNWNALALAYIRLGRFQRAVWIVEHVLTVTGGGTSGRALTEWQSIDDDALFDSDLPLTLRSREPSARSKGTIEASQWRDLSRTAIVEAEREFVRAGLTGGAGNRTNRLVRHTLMSYRRFELRGWFVHRATLRELDRAVRTVDEEQQRVLTKRWPRTFKTLAKFMASQRTQPLPALEQGEEE